MIELPSENVHTLLRKIDELEKQILAMPDKVTSILEAERDALLDQIADWILMETHHVKPN